MSVAKTEAKPTGLALLRVPFEKHHISKLPKPYKSDSPKGKCPECGGYHGLPAMHLDYVGHAALTDRLLDADPSWTWEPVAMGQDGQPMLDSHGGMWIKLTVCGVTRLGYGDAQGKTGGNAVKERIGDALRNAAMRFGAALDLWHKGDLHGGEGDTDDQADEFISADQVKELRALIATSTLTEQEYCAAGNVTKIEEIAPENYESAKTFVRKRQKKPQPETAAA